MIGFIVLETCDKTSFMVNLSMEFHENMPDLISERSYGIFQARLMGLSYGNYLKYCCTHGGEIKGRQGVPHIIYKNKVDAQKICDYLNEQCEKLLEKYTEITND